MVIFAAIAMLMTVLAGFILLAWIDWATQDRATRQLDFFLGMLGIGLPLVWSLLNIMLLITRAQTGGQYVAGVRLAREDGEPLSTRDTIAWWFCLIRSCLVGRWRPRQADRFRCSSLWAGRN